MLRTARLAGEKKGLTVAKCVWKLEHVVNELALSSERRFRDHSPAACLSVTEECRTAAFLAAAQVAAVTGNTQDIAELVSEALRCSALAMTNVKCHCVVS